MINGKIKSAFSTISKYISPLILSTFIIIVSISMLPELYNQNEVPKGYIYKVVFLSLILLSFLFLSIILLRGSILVDGWIHYFLELGDERRFTFSTSMAFLGEQALCSFLTTASLIISKEINSAYGEVWAGISSYLMFMVIVVIMGCSLMRFILIFNNCKVISYFLSGGISFLISQSLFRIGFLLAPT